MKKAFTFAEVLLTVLLLGIVVSIITPVIYQSYQKQAQIVQIRKVVSDFENAADLLITEEGKSHLGVTSIFSKTNGLSNFMTNKFEIIKTCNSTSDCFYNGKYKSINGRTKSYSCSEGYLLANSSVVCVSKGGGTNNIPRYLHIQVDTNGIKAPNTGGRDMFNFYINEKAQSVSSIANLEEPKDDSCTGGTDCTSCTGQPYGTGCLALLRQNNWKMNY